jgi:hypothetical protein
MNMVLQKPRTDIVVLDKMDRTVAVVEVSAVKDAGADALVRLEAYLQQTDEHLAYAILADLSTIRIFRVYGDSLGEEVATLSTVDVAVRYDGAFASKRIFHDYLAAIVNAWLDDIAYRWKSAEPPGDDVLRSIGLAQQLEGGRTVQEFALDV